MIAAILGDMLDFFDYFLIGYVLAFIVHDWNLTYGQSALILLAAGVGAVPGAFFWGWMADKIGRRKAFIGTALNFSIATGIMALTPDRDWVFLTVFRFFVGFGVSGLFAVDTTLVQEYVPASKRGWVGGLVTSCLPLGFTLGAVLGRFATVDRGHRQRAGQPRRFGGCRPPLGIADLSAPAGFGFPIIAPDHCPGEKPRAGHPVSSDRRRAATRNPIKGAWRTPACDGFFAKTRVHWSGRSIASTVWPAVSTRS